MNLIIYYENNRLSDNDLNNIFCELKEYNYCLSCLKLLMKIFLSQNKKPFYLCEFLYGNQKYIIDEILYNHFLDDATIKKYMIKMLNKI